jgi:hypothetical protein
MHVRLMPTLGLVLALSSACALHAQSNVHFGVSGGVALPIGDLGNAANVGFDLGARLTVPLTTVVGIAWRPQLESLRRQSRRELVLVPLDRR